MADGTRGYIELKAITTELQKNQEEVQGTLKGMQESMENLQVMMNKLVSQQVNQNGSNGSSSGSQMHGHSEGSTTQGNGGKTMKFEIPHFSGGDVEYWIFKVEEFFAIYATPKAEWTQLASVHMEGVAYAWYMWSKKNGLFSDWESFLVALRLRFGDSLYNDPRQALKELKQEGTVEEYQGQFETIANKATALQEEWLISFFIGGLKDYLKYEVKLSKPTSYYEAVSMAKMLEEREQKMELTGRSTQTKSHSLPGGKTYSSSLSGNYSSYNTPSKSYSTGGVNNKGAVNSGQNQGSNTVVSQASISNKTLPYKRFTAAELKERRRLGLCYYCPEKYSRTHKCQPTYCLLLGCEEMEEFMHYDVEGELKLLQSEVESQETVEATPEISFNALEGQFHPSTLRVTGRYREQPVHILIDNGSTHNFVKSSVAEKLGLPLEEIKPFRVQTGSGAYLECKNLCADMELIIQNHVFMVDLFVLDLKGSDVVLGVQWLAGLGDIVINHKELRMSFQWGDGNVKIQGESLLIPEPINGKGIKRLAIENTLTCLFSLQKVVELEGGKGAELPGKISQLLNQYSVVFEEPKQLPPAREIDHKIGLLPGTKPVSIRPYRYPYFQKAEIERLVEEMLQGGIIRDNHSASIPEWTPLAYFSKKLTKRLSLASAYVRELYAITQAVMKWRHYLLGRRFTIKTDHKSLKELMYQVVQTPEQQFYLSKLLGFDFEIIYRIGRTNLVADALSRREEFNAREPAQGDFHSFTQVRHAIFPEIREANITDEELMKLHQQYNDKQLPTTFTVKDGIMLYEGRIFIPASAKLKNMIFTTFHDSVMGGHSGVTKTYKAIAEIFWWRRLRKEVQEYVSKCSTCQQVKYSTDKKQGLLQPIPVADQPWQELTMDFIVSLPNSHGYTAIMVVVDRFTKVAHLGALKPGFTAATVADLFISVVVKLHEFPRSIISDRDAIFLSKFWRQFMTSNGTSLHYSTSYHPESDGQTEEVNRCIEQYLRAFTFDNPKKWKEFFTLG
ncbi:Ty3/gypsy retrotransposon protein [Senna tora]|uniref:Ty3/gypsy retrotransposon protein n=1 Tax=Senna tora TaxID=362788 RepID=A0A834TA43_9FABA|nr:Ty3/gypsy retrotransposon protein [Senna tora]